jgi:hypothetical protein
MFIWLQRNKYLAIRLSILLLLYFSFCSPVFADWYDANWQHRKAINLDGAKFCTSVGNFPVPVILSGDTGLQADARADGFDILFTANDEVTKIPHEIEYFNKATGDLVVWVQVDITSGMDQTVYMYYGNVGAVD